MVSQGLLSKEEEASIGVMDSGMGGLTVLRRLWECLPQENFIYLADTAYRPYGDREPAEIKKRSLTLIRWMAGQGVKLIVMACHTSSALLDPVEDEVQGVPIVTMTESTLSSIMSLSFRRGLGLLATALTIRQGVLIQGLHARGFAHPIHGVACPDLVPLMEQQQWERARQRAEHYLTFFQTHPVDYIVHGCTHYPLLFPSGCTYAPMIDPAQAVAKQVVALLHPGTKNTDFGTLRLYHTGSWHNHFSLPVVLPFMTPIPLILE